MQPLPASTSAAMGSLAKDIDRQLLVKNIKPGRLDVDLAIGFVNPKFARNIATAIRSCSCFKAKYCFYTGQRIAEDLAKKGRLPREERMKGYADVRWGRCDRFLDLFAPDVVPVAVEVRQNSEHLWDFVPPPKALYIFGPEDGSIPKAVLHACHRFVIIPSAHCMNMATAASNLLSHHRYLQYMALMRTDPARAIEFKMSMMKPPDLPIHEWDEEFQ